MDSIVSSTLWWSRHNDILHPARADSFHRSGLGHRRHHWRIFITSRCRAIRLLALCCRNGDWRWVTWPCRLWLFLSGAAARMPDFSGRAQIVAQSALM
jgi:hypothetical protein